MSRWHTLDGRPARIIAHRGASGLYPEHSRPAYERAVADAADVLEPDLVPSRDGVLFARHDAWLSRSTDIAARRGFEDRREIGIDGREDWWSDRFNASELRSLHALQPFPQRDHSHDGRHPLLDFDSVLDLALNAGKGVYPELKHPGWYLSRGIDVTALLIDALTERGLRGAEAPIWVQCFEPAPLFAVHRSLGLKVFPLVRFDPTGARRKRQQIVDATREFASGFAIDKRLLLLPDAERWIGHMHDQGRAVHVWTFRDDVLAPVFDDPAEELDLAFALGVDAVFCDFPATGVRAREAFEQRLARRG